MLAHSAPWAARAWQHWHRPWAVTHASWLHDAGCANELSLRLHYPAWCRQYALEPALTEFDDTPWWRLFSLAPATFEQAARRVGWTLMFAADRRLRLLRDASVDVAGMRWALERAHFMPEPVVAALGEAGTRACAEAHAALSLRWCLDAAPALWERMQLRFAREHVPADRAVLRPRRIDPAVRTHLARLWRAGTRFEQEETSA